ncbi:NADH-quinone oxidoreductase subunit L [Elusimicrobiota bacterium]
MNILLYPIIVPIIAAILTLITPKKLKGVKEGLILLATAFNLVIAILLFKKELVYLSPWAGFGMDFSLRLYGFSAFIIFFAAIFGFLTALYSIVFMHKRNFGKLCFAFMLITIGFLNGAVLANNLIVMLFFWEGILLTVFGLIIIGHKGAYKTAVKAFIIAGVADLCMMFGIGLTYYLSGTLTMTDINIPVNTALGATAFVFFMIGAISKGGAMPFHSWIPDAAIDAPMPFMAFLPASLEKLLGIYLLTRLALDMFQLNAGSWLTTLLMIIGAVTIILAVMMALVQKDFKKLLSYHAISQVGYMILGIGTAIPIGIVGGIFHMINNAMYKSALFFAGGSVEKQVGTTDLKKLGGIGRLMPVTFICFLITAAAISGVPPLNGFISKELIYDAALNRHWMFYAAALIGSFLTAASFLKLGHSAFLGKINDDHKNVKEVPWPMLVPMITIAAGCILFGVYNALPIRLIKPVLGAAAHGLHFAGFHFNMLVVGTLIVLALALLNHIYGVKRSGAGVGASDHIRNAPLLSWIYTKAENRFFDPYDIGLKIVNLIALSSYYIDKAISWLSDVFAVKFVYFFSSVIKKVHTGNYSTYVVWIIFGSALIVFFVFKSI